jgi:hypothetical protein
MHFQKRGYIFRKGYGTLQNEGVAAKNKKAILAKVRVQHVGDRSLE